MSETNPLVLALQEKMRQVWPGMSEQDNLSMARSGAVMGVYRLGPDSLEQEGVPKGQLVDGSMVSQIYPGSTHEYKIYVPAQYTGEPVPYMVFLDGITQYLSPMVNANVVLDNLIAAGRIPAMIGIFVEPGDKGDGMPIYGGGFVEPGSNRGKEYDSTDDLFSRFLLEELIPLVAKDYALSEKPEDHALCGASSAAQAAFSAAWHRPDQFRKVVSHIGSFTAIRGGDCNPDRIRKNPAKPIRIFLQDGSHDLNIIYGDWVLANKTMASALEYRGYDYKYVLGEGGHNIEHGGAILPETLEWLWRADDGSC